MTQFVEQNKRQVIMAYVSKTETHLNYIYTSHLTEKKHLLHCNDHSFDAVRKLIGVDCENRTKLNTSRRQNAEILSFIAGGT